MLRLFDRLRFARGKRGIAFGAAIIAACTILSCAPTTARAASYQMALDTAVFLTARDPFNSPFVADFALTSPKGPTRHVRVASDKTGEATVQFGGPSTNGAFGTPEGDFAMQVPGTWHWTCRVKTRVVAHGSFVVQFDGHTGRMMVQTQPAEF